MRSETIVPTMSQTSAPRIPSRKATRISWVGTLGLLLAVGSSMFGLAAPAASGLKQEPIRLEPAKRYSGSVPIDLSNGLPMNNGTFGLPNSEYQVWGDAPMIAPGVSEKTYPYAAKRDFINSLDENLRFMKTALANWEEKGKKTLPEAVEYSNSALEKIKPLVEKAEDAFNQARDADQSAWQQAQARARDALLVFWGTYRDLHRNTKTR